LPPLKPELRVTAGSPAAAGRYSYICSLRSAASPFSDSFCGCAVVAPRVVLTAAHCLDQDDPSLRLPRVDIGRYRRLDVLLANGDPPTEADDGIQRLRCDRTVVHPGWSFATTRNDVALCYLEGPTSWPAVGLAGGTSEGQRLAETAGTPLAVVGWGTERAGAAEQAQILMRAEVPVFDLQACNATFRGALRRGQMCAGSAAAYGQIVPDACQGDSGGPLILEGDGEPGSGSNGGDVQVGIVSFGESCGYVVVSSRGGRLFALFCLPVFFPLGSSLSLSSVANRRPLQPRPLNTLPPPPPPPPQKNPPKNNHPRRPPRALQKAAE